MDWLLFRLSTAVLAALACLSLSVFSYLKNRSKRINKLFSLFNLFLALWNIGDILIVNAPSKELALLIDRLGYFWATPIIPLIFYMCHEISGKRKIPPLLNWVTIGICVFLMAAAPTPWIIKDVITSPNLVEIPGPLYFVFIFYLIFNIGYAVTLLFKSMRSATGNLKNQLKYTFVAFSFAFLAGLSYLAFMLDPTIPPIFYIPEMIYVAVMGYAILRYRAMDISVAFRRVGLFITVYAALLIASAPLVYVFNLKALPEQNFPIGLMGIEVLFLALVLSLGPFLYAYIVRRSTYFHEHAMAGLTHELKSPLAAIENAVEMLTSKMRAGGDQKDQTVYVEMIDRNAARLKTFVNDLLQVYRIQDKKLSLNLCNVDIQKVSQKIIDERKELARQKNNTLVLRSEINGAQLTCDEQKIGQALSNLISNAIKFTENGSINVDISSTDNHIAVTVADTGSGISPQDLPHLFDRFFQGTSNKSSKGSGIGLTIAKAWVEAHGGKIWAESEGEGKGTKITFTLPI